MKITRLILVLAMYQELVTKVKEPDPADIGECFFELIGFESRSAIKG